MTDEQKKLVSWSCEFCEKTYTRELDFEPFKCPGCGRLYQLAEMVNIAGFDFQLSDLSDVVTDFLEGNDEEELADDD